MSDRTSHQTDRSLSTDALQSRLVATGMGRAEAHRVVAQYLPGRVSDVLDALDRLQPGAVRDPARWTTDVLRQGQDPAEVLAAHRRAQARDREWEQQAAGRAEAATIVDRRLDVAGRWEEAVSSVLDEATLTTAIERATTPVGGLDRRSVPVCVAQLVRWAAAVHSRDPQSRLRDVLDESLAQEIDQHEVRTSLEGPLPEPPPTERTAQDELANRVAELLDLHPDLAWPIHLRRDQSPDLADDLPPSLER